MLETRSPKGSSPEADVDYRTVHSGANTWVQTNEGIQLLLSENITSRKDTSPGILAILFLADFNRQVLTSENDNWVQTSDGEKSLFLRIVSRQAIEPMRTPLSWSWTMVDVSQEDITWINTLVSTSPSRIREQLHSSISPSLGRAEVYKVALPSFSNTPSPQPTQLLEYHQDGCPNRRQRTRNNRCSLLVNPSTILLPLPHSRLTPPAHPANHHQLPSSQHDRSTAFHDASLGMCRRPSWRVQHRREFQYRAADTAADIDGLELDYLDSVLLLR